jgi:hypothetical protein
MPGKQCQAVGWVFNLLPGQPPELWHLLSRQLEAVLGCGCWSPRNTGRLLLSVTSQQLSWLVMIQQNQVIIMM